MTNELYQVLNEPSIIKHQIRLIDIQINDTRLMMLPSAIRYDRDKVMSSPSDSMIQFAEKLDELEQKKRNLEKEYLIKRDELVSLVDRLNNKEMKDIMYARYIEDIGLYKMERRVNMSKSKIYQVYSKAIKLLEKQIVEKNGKNYM